MKAETRKYIRDELMSKLENKERDLIDAARYGWTSVDACVQEVAKLWDTICDFEEDEDE